MLKKTDISWFDLRKYDKLNEVDLIGWHRQIQIRTYLLNHEDYPEYPYAGMWIDRIKINPIFSSFIPDDEDDSFEHLITRPLGKAVLYNTTLFEHLLKTNDKPNSDDIRGECILKNKKGVPQKRRIKIPDIPMSALQNSIKTKYDEKRYITIDLNASDQQLLNEFNKWLRKQRVVADYPKYKKNTFTDLVMKDWVKSRLLPYIDLVIINDFEKLRILKVKIAKLLENDDDFNGGIYDKTRRTIKTKAMNLFTDKIVQQMESQIASMPIRK